MKTFLAAILLCAISGHDALAQKMCDKFRSSTTTGAQAITEKVPAVAGKRIYICGWVLIANSSQPLSFDLLTGTGTNCATNQTELLNNITMPPNSIMVNRIPYASGESTPPGQAVCLRTTGGAQATVSSIWYYAQF
jgi:hypothetical protein